MRKKYKIYDTDGNWSTYEFCPEESGLDDVFRNIETGISLSIYYGLFPKMLDRGEAIEIPLLTPRMYLSPHRFNKPLVDSLTGQINLRFNPLDVEEDYYFPTF